MKTISLISSDGEVVSNLTDIDFMSKIEPLIQKCIDFKQKTKNVAKLLSFDGSKEIYLKGKSSITIIHHIFDYMLLLYFEMNSLKVEFFDCEHFMSTLDDY